MAMLHHNWIIATAMRTAAIITSAVLLPAVSMAQCSMCRAVTGSGQFNDDTFVPGRGLNDAILYLMAMPYLMAAIFVFVFFRKPIIAWFKGNAESPVTE